MMTGDSYSIPINLTVNGEGVSAERFQEIEVCIGRVRKTLTSGEIVYDAEQSAFLVPLTQKETFSLAGRSRINVRCKFHGGSVVGIDLGVLEFEQSLSKEVL